MKDLLNKVEFTKEMKKTHTILVPNVSSFHFSLLKNLFEHYGYRMELLETGGKKVTDLGLAYIHNDACYPALICAGQFLEALESGRYDNDKIAFMMVQTGGGCRASNYISIIRKALAEAGYAHVPVISANLAGLEKNSGMKITLPMLQKALMCICMGDILMELYHQVLPHETEDKKYKKLLTKWTERLSREINSKKWMGFAWAKSRFCEIVKDFSDSAKDFKKTVKVGIVGEIFVKYSSAANNSLEEFLHKQGYQVSVPGLLPYLHYAVDNAANDVKFYGGNVLKKVGSYILGGYLGKFEKMMINSIKQGSSFSAPEHYRDMKKSIEGVITCGCKMGEGWILTAEIIHLMKSGVHNIICAQPFGCLPNHIVGKGMFKQICEKYKGANIVAIDYDPGASKVNQENRIKLMLSNA